MTVDGVVWESLVPDGVEEGTDEFVGNMSLRAGVGDRWVFLALANSQILDGTPLEEPEVIEFLQDLRVGSPDVLTPIGEACWQCGVAGAEGDPYAATDSPTTEPETESDGAQSPTSQPPAPKPDNIGSDIGRPLTELAADDIVVPTYIPPGLTLVTPAQIHGYPGGVFSFYLQTVDGTYPDGPSVSLGGPTVSGPSGPSELDDPNHPPVEIAGLTWAWNDFESARIARIGSTGITVHLQGLDRTEADRFIEGLRAASIEHFPGPIATDGTDGLTVINPTDPQGPEVVASDDQFELTAVRAGDQVCTKLEQTTVPATMIFAGNCWESTRLDESGIVDFSPLDATDTKYLIIGVLDAPDATEVRLTSPDGNTVVAPTGPANHAIDGRFFLARLDLDLSDGVRLDHFTIEDASP